MPRHQSINTAVPVTGEVNAAIDVISSASTAAFDAISTYTPGDNLCDARNISACLPGGSHHGTEACKKYANDYNNPHHGDSICCSYAAYEKQTTGKYTCQDSEGAPMYNTLGEMGFIDPVPGMMQCSPTNSPKTYPLCSQSQYYV